MLCKIAALRLNAMNERDIAKLCEDYDAAAGALEVVKNFEDGARVVRLYKTLALSRALEKIGHCTDDPDTGDKWFYFDEEYEKMRDRENYALFSLRDTEGRDTLIIEAEKQTSGAW